MTECISKVNGRWKDAYYIIIGKNKQKIKIDSKKSIFVINVHPLTNGEYNYIHPSVLLGFRKNKHGKQVLREIADAILQQLSKWEEE